MKHIALFFLFLSSSAFSSGCYFLPDVITLESGVVLKRYISDTYEVVSTPPVISPEIAQQIAENNAFAMKQAGADITDPNSTISIATKALNKINEEYLKVSKELLEQRKDTNIFFSMLLIPDLERRQSQLSQSADFQINLIQRIQDSAKELAKAANLPLYAKLDSGSLSFTDRAFYLQVQGQKYLFTMSNLNIYSCKRM